MAVFCRSCDRVPPPSEPRAVANEPTRVYQGEYRGPGLTGNNLRQRGLLDREKRPDLVATRTDNADRPGDDQEREIAGGGERQAGGRHEHGTHDQHTAAPDPVAVRPEVE